MPVLIDKNKLSSIKEPIVRTMGMIREDFKEPTEKLSNYVDWFEKQYKYKFRYKLNNFVVKKGEIFYCDFGDNIGSEQEKLRPAIILQNDKGNFHSPTTIVAPITDEIKPSLPTHVDISELKNSSSVSGVILIEQLRCISKTRLKNKIEVIDTTSEKWNKIIRALKIELDVFQIVSKK